MNFIKTTVLLCILSLAFCAQASSQKVKISYSDDLQKKIDNLTPNDFKSYTALINELRENNGSIKRKFQDRIMFIENTTEDTTTIHYANGNHTSMRIIGPEMICEVYDRTTGRTHRNIFIE